MATCPRCKGPLTENHRCPRRPLAEALEAIGVSVGGGLAALAILALFETSQTVGYLDLGVFIVGSLLARGIHVYLRTR